MSLNKLTISEELKHNILANDIEPTYKHDVQSMLKNRKYYTCTGRILETSAKIAISIGGILSFASGYYTNIPFLSFVAGSVNVVSLALIQLSTYVYQQSENETKQLNKILTTLNIQNVAQLPYSNLTQTVYATQAPPQPQIVYVQSPPSLPYSYTYPTLHMAPSNVHEIMRTNVSTPPKLPQETPEKTPEKSQETPEKTQEIPEIPKENPEKPPEKTQETPEKTPKKSQETPEKTKETLPLPPFPNIRIVSDIEK